MTKKPKVVFNEIKYEEALVTLAEQIVAAVREDEGDKIDLEEYTADTLLDIADRTKELFTRRK